MYIFDGRVKPNAPNVATIPTPTGHLTPFVKSVVKPPASTPANALIPTELKTAKFLSVPLSIGFSYCCCCFGEFALKPTLGL